MAPSTLRWPGYLKPGVRLSGLMVLCAGLIIMGYAPVQRIANSAGKVMPSDAAPLSQQVLRQFFPEPPTLDIGVSLYGARFFTFVFEPLCLFNEDVVLTPAAAERWSVSEDKLTWTFILRDGLKWSDGRPLTAQDFVWSFQRLIDPNSGNVYAFFYYPIKGAKAFNTGLTKDPTTVGVRALDEQTLQVETEVPCSYLPMILSFFTSVPAPRWQVEKYGKSWTEPGNLVNNATFSLDSWEHGSGMDFRLNPNYTGPYRAYLEQLKIIFAARDFNDVLAYENDEIDVANVDPSDYLRVTGDPILNAQMVTYPDFGANYLFFQTKRPPFSDPKVRQALALAIDQESISKVILAGIATPAYGMTPPDFRGYDAERLKTYQGFDPDRAQRLLGGAGYPGGTGFPAITLTVREPTSQERNVSVAIQQMLKDNLNIRVVLEEQPMASFNRSMVDQSIPFGFVWYYADYFDISNMFDPAWRHRPAGAGRQDWHHPEFERLIDEAAGTFEDDRRIDLYTRAEEVLSEDAGGVFLYHTMLAQLFKPRIKGLTPNRQGQRRWGRQAPDYARLYIGK